MKTTPGLDELKDIVNRCLSPKYNLREEVLKAGYQLKERTPWDAVIMEHGDDKFIIQFNKGGIYSLVYRCEKLDLSVDLVVEGKKAFEW